MVRHRLAALALLSAGVVACAPKAPAPTPPAALTDQEVLAEVRGNYQRVDPHARVGLVTAVAPDADLVAVGDLDLAGFREGDYLTIIDPQQNIIANGRVVAITRDAVHVRYDSQAATRVPQKGDLAVAATLTR